MMSDNSRTEKGPNRPQAKSDDQISTNLRYLWLNGIVTDTLFTHSRNRAGPQQEGHTVGRNALANILVRNFIIR